MKHGMIGMKIEDLLNSKNFYLAAYTAESTNEGIANRKAVIKSFIPDIKAYSLFFDSLMKIIKPDTLYQIFGIWTESKQFKVLGLPLLFCTFSKFKQIRLIDPNRYILNTDWEDIEESLIKYGCEIVYINNEKDFESIYFKRGMKNEKI